jgi:3-oxoacyl-[acyl-carrier-protein] synthase II
MTWAWPDRPRRVVVTGMGALSALGGDVASTWDGLVAGRSGIARVAAFDPSRLDSQIAAEVKDFDPSGILDRKEMRRTDRYIQFALVCARQALDSAGLPGRLAARWRSALARSSAPASAGCPRCSTTCC